MDPCRWLTVSDSAQLPRDMDPLPLTANFPEKNITATVFGVRSLSLHTRDMNFNINKEISFLAKKYEGKVIFQKASGRGREDGLFYVLNAA